MKPNAIPEPERDVAARIAQRSVAKREATYADEVRRLLGAGRQVMRRCGTTSRPRVADIVSVAGLSNEAFYRHFPSKEALVAAILEDGTDQLSTYLAHQMAKETSAEAKVRRWVAGVMSQAIDDEIARTTLAVLWNAGGGGAGAEGLASGHSAINGPLATLLEAPFATLGSPHPKLDASLASHATIGRLSDCLRQQVAPSQEEVEEIARFCLRAATR